MATQDEFNPETQRSAPSLDASTRPAGSLAATEIPDLMKIGAAPVNTQMDVETDILEPVVFSESFCRFRLQNKGILHSNSKLTFAVDISNGSKNTTFLPFNIGIHSIIDRAVLKSGTKTICETSDFNHFMNFRSTFINPQHNKQRESITSGRQMCRKWEYNNASYRYSDEGNGGASGTTQSIYNASYYTLDTGVEVDKLNNLVGVNRDILLPHYNYMNGSATTTAGAGGSSAPVFQITLNDLFPFLKMNQLPLYMMNEELDIELHFSDESQRCCVRAGETDTYSAKLIQNECKMVADYIFYPQEIMDAYRNSNSKMSFTYVDYRLVKHTVVAAGDVVNDIILNVGGAGRVVNKLFFCLNPTAGANPERSINNEYRARGLKNDSAGTSLAVINHNIKFNDKNLYPLDVKNIARVFHNIQQAEGSVPFISKDEFCDTQSAISLSGVEGYELMSEIAMESFWIEDRLNRNERINSRGIEVYNTWDSLIADTYTMRCWLEIVRFATLENGILTPSYA